MEDHMEDRRGINLEDASKLDNPTLLMHSLLAGHLSPSWVTGEPPVGSADQSPAPGSLALDPALNEGFSGSTLEQITDEFLSVQAGGKAPQSNGHEVSHDLVRWEEMANNPIFDLESSMTSGGPPAQTELPANNIGGMGHALTHNSNSFDMDSRAVKKTNTKRGTRVKGNNPKKRRTSKITDH
jgi:hypothetical protein